MRRTPGFSALVIAVLAVAIGANAALFSIIDRVILNPFPYREPGRLLDISGRTDKGRRTRVSPAAFNFMQNRVPAFERSAMWTWHEFLLTGVSDPESLWALQVSPATFDILGVPPLHGRLFQRGDFRADAPPAAILSYGLWRRQFNADPAIIGRQILLDQEGYTVVGIMGPDFMFNRPGYDVWLPLKTYRMVKEELKYGYMAMARLRPGATLEQAQHEMDALAPSFPKSPDEPGGWHPLLHRFSEEYVGEYRRALYVLWSAVLFVLLIACANAANLLLARSSTRKREFAIRASLGAGRFRLIRQLLGETLLLGMAAGATGIGLAVLMLRLLLVAFPEPVAFIRPEKLALTPDALLVTVAAVLATTFLCALPSCWDLWRSNLSGVLHSSGRSASTDRVSNRTRSALVALEFALSVTLLIGAGLMVESLIRVLREPLGFNPDHVLTARVSAPPQLKTKDQLVPYFDRVLEQVDSIPGTRSSAIVTLLPMGNLVVTTSFSAEDQPQRAEDWHSYSVRLLSVSPHYFRTMGVRLLRGRPFDDRDTSKSPGVAIVNDELARHYWPGQDPIGKRVSRSDHPRPEEWITVVGVIESPANKPAAELYRPFAQDTTAARATSLVVRTNTDPLSIASILGKRIHALNRDQPVTEVKTMDTWVRAAGAQPRFNTALIEVFAVLAFILAVSGVFAVVSYAVTQRKREIGIRGALGATRRDIVAYVLGIGMRPVLAGTLIGVAGAIAISRVVLSRLFDAAALNPAVFAVVLPVLLAAAALAAALPAHRATRIEPAVTLRSE